MVTSDAFALHIGPVDELSSGFGGCGHVVVVESSVGHGELRFNLRRAHLVVTVTVTCGAAHVPELHRHQSQRQL